LRKFQNKFEKKKINIKFQTATSIKDNKNNINWTNVEVVNPINRNPDVFTNVGNKTYLENLWEP
jgi:hypothetical protein